MQIIYIDLLQCIMSKISREFGFPGVNFSSQQILKSSQLTDLKDTTSQ